MIACFAAITSDMQQRIEEDPPVVEGYLNPEDEEQEPPDSMDVEKAWHGIHFLLTGQAWGGEGPLALAVLGGREIGGDVGYGPARLLTPNQVSDVAHALASIDAAELKSRFNPKAMSAADVYPAIIWERDGLEALEYVIEYYEQLVQFYRDAAERGNAALLWLC